MPPRQPGCFPCRLCALAAAGLDSRKGDKTMSVFMCFSRLCAFQLEEIALEKGRVSLRDSPASTTLLVGNGRWNVL